jgi:hypothetical protein
MREMAQEKGGAKPTVNFDISFPLAPKEKKEKLTAFSELLSLIADDKERLKVDLKPNKTKLEIILSSDEFGFGVYLKERVSVNIGVADPEKNIKKVNEIGNEILSFISTVLGEGATGSKIMTTTTTRDKGRESINLSKKIIGDTRLAKINNKIKLQLNPLGIFFEYKLNERDFLIGSLSNRTVEMFTSHKTYKDAIPLNVLLNEYHELKKPKKVMELLSDMELK